MNVSGRHQCSYSTVSLYTDIDVITSFKVEHLSSPPVFIGVRVTRYLVLCVCFVDHCLSFCTFSFGHCVICPSIYGFGLPFGIFKLCLNTEISFCRYLRNPLVFILTVKIFYL